MAVPCTTSLQGNTKNINTAHGNWSSVDLSVCVSSYTSRANWTILDTL